MDRIITSAFDANDASSRAQTSLLAGEVLTNCRIERHSQAQVDAGEEPYVVRFETSGREYLVALAVFQARTQPPGGVGLPSCARAEGAS